MACQQDAYEIVFLPWVRFDWEQMGDQFRIGPCVFRPYQSVDIPYPKLKKWLDSYFQSYVDLQGKPVDTITLCIFENQNEKPFIPLDDPASRSLQELALRVLAFSLLWQEIRRKISTGFNTAPEIIGELLVWYTQRTNLTDLVALPSGRSLIVDEPRNFVFQIPQEAVLRPAVVPEAKLLQLFTRLFEKSFDTYSFRILRVLEWFHQAHMSSPIVSEETHIVQIATAFEVLIPELGKAHSEKAKIFADKIEKWSCQQINPELFEIVTNDNGQKSQAWLWARDFYRLRNRIVHGEVIEPQDLVFSKGKNPHSGQSFTLTQKEVASFILGAFLIDELRNRFQTPHPDDILQSEDQLLSQLLEHSYWNLSACFKALDWVRPKEPLGNRIANARKHLISLGWNPEANEARRLVEQLRSGTLEENP